MAVETPKSCPMQEYCSEILSGELKIDPAQDREAKALNALPKFFRALHTACIIYREEALNCSVENSGCALRGANWVRIYGDKRDGEFIIQYLEEATEPLGGDWPTFPKTT